MSLDSKRALQKLDRIEKLLEHLLERDVDFNVRTGSNWIDSTKVRQILGISESTMYRIRKKKIIVPHRIGGRDYYYAADIFNTAKTRIK